MPAECAVCAKSNANYTCPRCNAHYCSLDCYKNHSTQCTDTFYRETATEELRSLTTSSEDKRKMEEILMRLHEQQLEDAESSNSSEEDKEELLEGLPLQKAILLAQGDISLDDLTPQESAAFQRELAAGTAQSIEPWEPWWLTTEASELELGPSGTRLVQIAEISPQEESKEQPASALPEPPAAPLPPISALTSKSPSAALSLHLLDLLYSYCLTLRLFNGQYITDIVDAVITLLDASIVLCPPQQAAADAPAPVARPNVPSAGDLPSNVLLNCIVHVCSTHAGRAQVPRGFAVGILSDVAAILELGRSVIVTALMDLSRILDAGLTESKASKDSAEYKTLITQVQQAQRKILFFLSWANEYGDAVCPPLAMATRLSFELQRKALETQASKNEPRDNDILIK